MKTIKITIGNRTFRATLFATPTGEAIANALPLEAKSITWGDEIYFAVPVHTPLESEAVSEVSVGALAYWPTMPAFCIFFGPTPASIGSEPRAASSVNVFGKLVDFNIDELQNVREGEQVVISSE